MKRSSKWAIVCTVIFLLLLLFFYFGKTDLIFLSLLSLISLSLISHWVSTKRKRSKDFLKNVIDSIDSPLVIVNSNLEAIQWNTAVEEVLHLPAEDIYKKNLTDLFPFLQRNTGTFKDLLENHSYGKIDKIADDQKHDFEVLFYPLSVCKFLGGVVHINNITDRIKMTESLIQNDKLASIGILTAGIAHEINNPINFIVASVDPLKRDFNDIFSVLDKYSKLEHDGEKTSQEITKINDFKKELDLDYTVEEIKQLLGGIEEGASRTADIVSNLRSFSRLDESDLKKVNIHEGIESTLSLLKSKYKKRIQIVKEYGDIPMVDCYPGKLNQVFMNILSNAIDAIKESGTITIKTFKYNDDKIAVSFKDTGSGIPEDVQKRIFEPFFTTKKVEQGTGLGLSISFGIVQDHKGEIQLHSKVGEGTEFVIILPISPKK